MTEKQETDPTIIDTLSEREEVCEYVKKHTSDLVPDQKLCERFDQSGSASSSQNIECDKESRFSSLGKASKRFEDSEFLNTILTRVNNKNDRMVDTLRRGSTMSLPAFKFSARGTQRSIHRNRKDSRCSTGSTSL